MDHSWPLEGNSAEKLNKVVDMLSFMLTLLHSVEDGRFSSIEVATNAETHKKAAKTFGIDRYPTEMELADQLGIARNSVREAVKILVYLGVLEIRRAEGTFVCSGFSDRLLDPAVYGITLEQRDTNALKELRAMIEAGVLRLAMQKCTAQEIATLSDRLADMRAAIYEDDPDPEKIFARDNAFHEVITAMRRNAFVTKINAITLLLTRSIRQDSVREMVAAGRGEELYLAHEQVFDLLVSRRHDDLYSSVYKTYFYGSEDGEA